MENAAQALLIAGGILLAILILSLVVSAVNSMSEFKNSEALLEDQRRLEEWNAEWTAYNKKLLYGTDVLTVINKAKQNNSEYENTGDYLVDVTIEKNSESITTENFKDAEENKNKIFECTGMEYSSKTGRINKISFKLIQ